MHDVRARSRTVEPDFVVHLLLDVAQFRGIDRRKVRKIETQARGLDERTGLLHVRSQNISQRSVHQMRAGVIALDVLAPSAVSIARDAIAYSQFFFGHTRCAIKPETG